MVRSVLAVLGSLLVVEAARVGAGTLAKEVLGGAPWSVLPVNLVYTVAIALLGGWLCGVWAGRKPLLHAAAFAGVILALWLPAVLRPEPGFPSWYGGVIAVLGPAFALVGGWLRERTLERQAPAPLPGGPPAA